MDGGKPARKKLKNYSIGYFHCVEIVGLGTFLALQSRIYSLAFLQY